MNFLTIAESLQNYFIIPLIMIVFVTIVSIRFYKKYIQSAKHINIQLESAINQLKEIESKNQEKRHAVNLIFAKDDSLHHAWKNYETSFHEIKETIDGEDVIVASRATVSSEIFFSQSVIIDTPLRVEFYKHLPGIITGVGILATFTGLLFGLFAFDPAGNPSKVQDSLALLLRGVGEAFLASGLAIATAMLITWRNKRPNLS